MKSLILTIAAAVTLSGLVVAQAGHHCGHCNHCGNYKVCRLVPDVTKVTTYEYYLKCEDFCIPGRSKCIGTTCKPDCNGCCKCEKVMQPTCGCVKTKGVVMKVPVVKEKHGWKCVVVHVCRGCKQCAEARPATDVELQMALKEAESQGILLTSAEEPILVAIPDDEPQQVAVPAVPELQQPTAAQPIRSIGSFFSK